MNQLATREAPRTPPKRRISKRLNQAIDLLVDGTVRTQKAAAERVGMSSEALCRALKRHETRVLIEAKIENRVGSAKMKAASVLESLLLDGKSEHARKDIAQWLLELSGFVVQKNAAPGLHMHLHANVSPGYVIDLSEPGDSNMGRTAIDLQATDVARDEAEGISALPTVRARGGRS